jgi:hypothetical protein
MEQIFVKDNQMEEGIKFLSKVIEKRFFYKEFISLEETLFLSKEMESKIDLLIIDPKMLVEQFHAVTYISNDAFHCSKCNGWRSRLALDKCGVFFAFLSQGHKV